MKVRKLAVALALAGGLGSGVAQALGLGEIDLQSYLNEPLDAEIDLRKSTGVDANDVFVNIASPQDYERVGLDRNQFLTQLKFNVTTTNDGSLVVNVTSKEPLREPYLNFLVEVTWPQGRLMREYAVLVDPPVYAEESNVPEQVSAPASTRQTTQAPQPMRTAPRADAGRSSESVARARTFGPTGSSDTLWSIAQQVRPSNNLSIQQVMLALQDINPDAFIGGNINRLKRGQVLRVPTAEQARARTRAEANRLVMAQNQAIEDARRPVDATDAPAPEAAPAGSAAGDELRLVVDDTAANRSAEEGGSAGGAGETAGGVDAGTAVALEELESARRENQELNSRLEDLQDQVSTLQRLIELKNTQLAELQQLEERTESGEQAGVTETGEPGEDGLPEEEVSEAGAEGAQDVAEGERPEDAQSAMETEESGDVAESGTGGDQPETDPEMAESTDDAGQAEEAVAPAVSPDAEEQVSSTEPAAPQEQRGFPGTVIDLIVNNPIYQIALGGGILLLLLALLLVSRKNSNREKAFYEQLNSEAEDGDDSFDLQLDDEGDMPHVEADDPLVEADAYVAYGRHDQAAQALETAISREPSRSDLRLKLLGIYADLKDRNSFEKQFNEIEALEEDDATDQANRLRERLEDAESVPSIDELESQLRSSHQEDDSAVFDQTLADQVESGHPEETDFDGDFDDLDLDKPRTPDESADEPESWDVADAEEEEPASAESDRDDLIEYDLSGIESTRKEESEAGDTDEFEVPEKSDSAETSATDDFGIDDSELEESLGVSGSDEGSEDEFDLELDTDDETGDLETGEADVEETGGRYAGFDESASEDSDDLDDLELDLSGEDESEDDDFGFDLDESLEEPASEADQQAADAEDEPEETGKAGDETSEDEDLGDLDESFLDELDAELDKVAAEDDDSAKDAEDSLDDLELDVSEDDVALMEKFAQSEDEDEPTTAIDEELGLEDAFTGEEEATPEEATEADELLDTDLDEDTLAEEAEDSLDSPAEEGSAEEEEPEPPVASDTADKQAGGSAIDLDESELGDDDDFDFLAGTDEAATKLDLARAYMEMGDVEGARDILEEVALEGNDDQKAEAQDLLKNLS